MKRQPLHSSLLVIALALGLAYPVSSFSDEPRHVSPEKFQEYALLPMGTMRYSEFLGISDGKAYIAVHEMSLLGSKEWSRDVYWVESEKLDPKLIQQLIKPKQ